MRDRMDSPPETGTGAGNPAARGNTTTVQGEDQHPVPRMPHERDESADSQEKMEPSNKRMAEKAQADVERGLVDTSKGAELDATYDRLRADVPDGGKQFRP